MFGYIRPMECELRVREQREYRAYYCGLCKAIGRRYGLPARLALHYDCTFLAAFLHAAGEPAQFLQKRCLCHPCRGKLPAACGSAALDYAADVNMLLVWYSASDHWQDEKRLSALAAKLFLLPAKRLAAKRLPVLDTALCGEIKKLRNMELSGTACTDEPSDAFGSIMRAVIGDAPGLTEAQRTAASWMFYNLGRWIYLIDAWDDREKDAKHGAYNPFLAAKTSREEAEFLLYMSVFEAEKGYDLVALAPDHGLVDNIVHLGCRETTRRILNKEKTE